MSTVIVMMIALHMTKILTLALQALDPVKLASYLPYPAYPPGIRQRSLFVLLRCR